MGNPPLLVLPVNVQTVYVQNIQSACILEEHKDQSAVIFLCFSDRTVPVQVYRDVFSLPIQSETPASRLMFTDGQRSI